MPKRYGSRFTKKRKTHKRRSMRRPRRSAKTTIRNSKPSAIIADRFITKMKYAERGTVVTGGAGISGAYLYNLNSVYDPNRTGVGHQPMGRDQLALLYHRYRVFAVSWRVTFFGNPAYHSLAVMAVNHEQSAQGQAIDTIRETARAIVKIGKADEPTVFTGRISLPRLNGQTAAEYRGADRFQALSGADPAELMTLQVCANTLNASVGYAFPYEIQLTYHVEWFDPLPVTQS